MNGNLTENQPLARIILNLFKNFEFELLNEIHKNNFNDITMSDLQIMHFIQQDGCLMADVVKRAGITKQAVGKSIQSLAKRKYLKLSDAENDKRAKKIQLTEKGKRLAENAIQIIQKIETKYIQKIGKDRFSKIKSELIDLSKCHLQQEGK